MSDRQRKRGNIVLMTSGGDDQFNRANEETIISYLSLSVTGVQASLPWFPVGYAAKGKELTSIFFGHTFVGWHTRLQFFNFLL